MEIGDIYPQYLGGNGFSFCPMCCEYSVGLLTKDQNIKEDKDKDIYYDIKEFSCVNGCFSHKFQVPTDLNDLETIELEQRLIEKLKMTDKMNKIIYMFLTENTPKLKIVTNKKDD